MTGGDTIKTFGDNLKKLRTDAGLTQETLAKRSGMTKQSISRYEKSDREPNIRTAKKIADALGVPLASLAPNSIELTPENDPDFKLLRQLFALLSAEDRKAVIAQLRGLVQERRAPGDR